MRPAPSQPIVGFFDSLTGCLLLIRYKVMKVMAFILILFIPA
jgi:hypothetical protein